MFITFLEIAMFLKFRHVGRSNMVVTGTRSFVLASSKYLHRRRQYLSLHSPQHQYIKTRVCLISLPLLPVERLLVTPFLQSLFRHFLRRLTRVYSIISKELQHGQQHLGLLKLA